MTNLWKWIAAASMTAGLIGGCTNMHKESAAEKEDAESPEVKVAFDQIPAPARTTIEKEAPGVTIKDVDKQMVKGKTAYEADAMIGATNYEIVVAEDGMLISKKIDDEAGEKAATGGEKKDQKNQTGEHED